MSPKKCAAQAHEGKLCQQVEEAPIDVEPQANTLQPNTQIDFFFF